MCNELSTKELARALDFARAIPRNELVSIQAKIECMEYIDLQYGQVEYINL